MRGSGQGLSHAPAVSQHPTLATPWLHPWYTLPFINTKPRIFNYVLRCDPGRAMGGKARRYKDGVHEAAGMCIRMCACEGDQHKGLLPRAGDTGGYGNMLTLSLFRGVNV